MNKNILLIVTLVLIGGAIFYFESQKTARPTDVEVVTVAQRDENAAATSTVSVATSSTAGVLTNTKPAVASSGFLSQTEKAKRYKLAKEITTPNGFINTDGKPISIAQYIGKKVVLVDFWTYSCINCQRTQPYLNAWWDKYEDDGLVIIGIHTPEFEFEKDFENVKKAVADEKIGYPVVLDNDFSTWYAYENRFWPRKYLIDIDGYIVYDHIGEGAYEETEKKIQELLAERLAVLNISGGASAVASGVVSPSDATTQNAAATPEIYFGAARNDALGNSQGSGQKGKVGTFTFSSVAANSMNPNLFYLSGKWNITNEYAESQSDGAKISLKYKAKNVFFVASGDGSGNNDSDTGEVEIKITRDGEPLRASFAGDDVQIKNGESIVSIKNSKLYKLIEDASASEHTIEITIPEGNLKAFTFTFG